MASFELISPVKRLDNGRCPKCGSKLKFISNVTHLGSLEDNGMVADCDEIKRQYVFCNCGYKSVATQIDLKLIPVDRIDRDDINWDKKYLESNTVIWGKTDENPFKKDKE